MSRYIIVLLAIMVAVPFAAGDDVDVLLLMPHLYGANYNFNSSQLQRLGFRVTTAAVSSQVTPCYSGLPVLEPDTLIQEIADITLFDAVAVMPSRWRYVPDPYGDLIQSPETLELLQEANTASIPIWATCAGPLVLAAADVLTGVDMQGRAGPDSTFVETYVAAGANYIGFELLPVQHGNIITTSRGQYYQRENCQAILSAVAASPSSSNRHRTGCSRGILDITSAAGGNFAVTGYDFSTPGNRSDVLLEMYDSQLNPLWSTASGSTGFEYGYCVIETMNGDLVVAGFTTAGGNEDVHLLRAAGDGTVLWTATMGGDSLDIATSVCEAPNGDLFVCGYTTEGTAGESDILLIRTDGQGNRLWEKRFGGAGPETADMIQLTQNGDVLITGSTGSFTANSDAYSILAETNGNLIWENFYGAQGNEGGYDRANAAVVTGNGQIAITGSTNDPDLCGIYFVLTDQNGAQTAETFHGNIFYDFGMDIIETPDGGFLIAGATRDRYSCDNDIYVIKLNGYGEMVWEEQYGSPELNEWANGLVPDGAGGYIIAGQRETAEGSFDVHLLRISDPQQGLEQQSSAVPQISPNPASESIILSNMSGLEYYTVYDASGRVAKKGSGLNGTISLDGLSTGVYTLVATSEGSSFESRFTILK